MVLITPVDGTRLLFGQHLPELSRVSLIRHASCWEDLCDEAEKLSDCIFALLPGHAAQSQAILTLVDRILHSCDNPVIVVFSDAELVSGHQRVAVIPSAATFAAINQTIRKLLAAQRQ